MVEENHNTEKEIWKPIPGFEEYSINTSGLIRRKRFLYGTLNPVNGYKYATLKRRKFYIHRLVMLAFVGPPTQEKYEVNHKNGIKTDNRLSNLEYVSRQYNVWYNFHVLKKIPNISIKYGEENKQSILSNNDVLYIRQNYYAGNAHHPGNGELLSKRFGVCKRSIQRIAYGRNWTHLKSEYAKRRHDSSGNNPKFGIRLQKRVVHIKSASSS